MLRRGPKVRNTERDREIHLIIDLEHHGKGKTLQKVIEEVAEHLETGEDNVWRVWKNPVRWVRGDVLRRGMPSSPRLEAVLERALRWKI